MVIRIPEMHRAIGERPSHRLDPPVKLPRVQAFPVELRIAIVVGSEPAHGTDPGSVEESQRDLFTDVTARTVQRQPLQDPEDLEQCHPAGARRAHSDHLVPPEHTSIGERTFAT